MISKLICYAVKQYVSQYEVKLNIARQYDQILEVNRYIKALFD